MGDKEFEEFLSEGEESEDFHDCRKKIFYDVIKLKMNTSAELFKTISGIRASLGDAPKDIKTGMDDFLFKIMEYTRESYDQLNFLLGMMVDEMDEEGEEDDPEDL